MAEGFLAEGDVTDELRNSENVSSWTYYHNFANELSLDLSYLNMDGLSLHQNLQLFKEEEKEQSKEARFLYLQHNRLDFVPVNITLFGTLRHLDLSSNLLTEIGDPILALPHLISLVARNNLLQDLPKKLSSALPQLEELNLGGNQFNALPPVVTEMSALKGLYLGGNSLTELPSDIGRLTRLEVLYLGGNQLKELPPEVGRLVQLRSLALCENRLRSLPASVSNLRRLRSLSLHHNQLTTLPPQIVTLKGLVELSLRDNPLVVRFVQDLTYDPPSLRELSARTVKLHRLPYSAADLPHELSRYLQSACRCVNPKCRGVYFDMHVEHIKFVDFCGKYRLPLLQYLCSPRCTASPSISESSSEDSDSDVPQSRLRRVLLG
jgi:Leucine-rich repeat (LRR) protein